MTNLISGRIFWASVIAAVSIALWVPGISYGQSPAQEGKIYWTGLERGIYRSGLDGKNAEQLVKPEWSYPGDIALDMPGNKMYWTDRRTGGWGTIGSIYRSTIDGTDIEILLVDSWIETPLGDKPIDLGEGWALFNPVELLGYHSCSISIALDIAGDKMYWTEVLSSGDVFTGGLLRANLDGSNGEYVSFGRFPGAITLDLVGDKVYWEEYDKIHRADLKGENLEYDLIRLGSGYIMDLALDVEGGKVYWTNSETKTIQRADLDGKNIEEVLFVPDGYPEKIVIDVDGGGIFWTNPATMAIHRADLDGENVQHLFDLEKDVKRHLCEPRVSIALDVGREKIYWTDSGPGKIKRANLNGQNPEILFDPVVREPYDILLYMDKMYWTDVIKGTIQRADLSGENIEVLISGLNRPEGIALLEGNKIYWTEGGPGEFGWIPEQGKIQAADLDGTNVQEIVTGLSHSGDIALDAVRGMIYWADFDRTENRNIFQRADLDGSNVETVPGLADVVDTPGDHMYVDTRVTVLKILHEKIYWTERVNENETL